MDIQRPDLKRKLWRRRMLWAGVVAVSLTVAGLFVHDLEPAVPRVAESAVWMDSVRSGEFVREVRGPGTLVPRETRWVSAASAGRVERVLVRPGALVEPDTVLVELSNPELVQGVEDIRWEVDALKAGLASLEAELERQLLDARSSLAATRAEHESAQLEAVAEEELAELGIVSRIHHQQSRLRADQLGVRTELETERMERLQASVSAQIQAERARLEQAKQRYRRQQQRLDDLSIRGGVAGVLQRVDVEEGQRVDPGVNVGRVARPDELIAELRISESQARDIQLDQQVTIDTRNAKVPGRVVRIDPAVVGGSVQVDVELMGELPPGVRPDLSVDGTIVLERLEDALFVGRPSHGQPESTATLFRLDDNSYAHRVAVELGRASVNVIEIRAGLNPGDRVILSDTSKWDSHDRIRLD
ncbi:efflux RND transporter periplasmic adaptor subunit [Wenzhouxiangella sp. AB-CW3]|uniref:efflux RND transporter periplasmic adaptor subunit n=1 Tax=Wenzhouxiangella sp. AB-CW3 TaxID=2771012 RepID=UPI00168BA142|nr:HlyD family efflux transporter periplasmic adaptor subunit [Wenzhouxiangella sp. AB-CW3]QOC22189.1 efflux RND transporter periplasmic adaptor subunit [Wenzhouxiangella sp. AB-CW3]